MITNLRILSIFVIHRTVKHNSTFVTDILNICPVMSMFLLVGQLACSFLAMSVQTISPSLSGTWSHLLQTKMAHSGSNCCNNPFCSNSSCFLNIFTSWNHTKQTKLLSRILEMFMQIPCCVEIRGRSDHHNRFFWEVDEVCIGLLFVDHYSTIVFDLHVHVCRFIQYHQVFKRYPLQGQLLLQSRSFL